MKQYCDECKGILLTIRVERYPVGLTGLEKTNYNRVCDLECQKCKKVYYSQSYDDNDKLNVVKNIK